MNDEKLEELRYYFTGYGSQHDETILKLIAQNKRYREAIVRARALLANIGNDTSSKMSAISILTKVLEESE